MNSLGQKKIALIYAGGTSFGSDFDITGLKKWLDGFLELQMMAKITPFFVWHGAGVDVQWDLAAQVAEVIKENYKQYDGFVVTHSVDNIFYTSSLLAFMQQEIGKPVIFATPNPDEEEETKHSPSKEKKQLSFGEFETLNIKSGLINAVQIATMEIAEVGLVFGNHLVRAVKPDKSLGKIQFGIQLSPHVTTRSSTKSDFSIKFDDNIKILEIYPQVELPTDIEKYSGVFVIGKQEQQVPTNWKLPKTMPVYIYNQDVKDFNKDTAVAKFVWALGQSKDPKQIKKIMKKNLAGEFK